MLYFFVYVCHVVGFTLINRECGLELLAAYRPFLPTVNRWTIVSFCCWFWCCNSKTRWLYMARSWMTNFHMDTFVHAPMSHKWSSFVSHHWNGVVIPGSHLFRNKSQWYTYKERKREASSWMTRPVQSVLPPCCFSMPRHIDIIKGFGTIDRTEKNSLAIYARNSDAERDAMQGDTEGRGR